MIRSFKTSSSDEIEIPDVTFDDIGGYDKIKHELKRIVALTTGTVPGIDEHERQNLIPRGFIFHGPPGTGKTLFAKAIANEMDATIQMVSGPEIMDKYVGQSESNIRNLFATARRNAPSVIFFDEFDSLASQRSVYSDGGARANNAVVAQLLTELDGFREEQAVLVIGTTNRLDIIDEALLRPSRLRPIEIKMPDLTARRRVAAIHARRFGVLDVLRDLCSLVLEHLADLDSDPSQTFLEELFARHPPYRTRYERESERAGFMRQLSAFARFVEQVTAEVDEQAGPDPRITRIRERLREIATDCGFNLDRIETNGADVASHKASMQSDLHDLCHILNQQVNPRFTPETFADSVMDMIAEYTEGFNNDEIRAIFQESSLDHHLEGCLITPRSLGLKLGMIRKRRDEREMVHLRTR